MPNGKTYTPEMKAKIAIEILQENNTISEIGAREGISPKLLGNWRREFLENAYRAFSVCKEERAHKSEMKALMEQQQELLAKIGQLTYECDWLKKKYQGHIGKG